MRGSRVVLLIVGILLVVIGLGSGAAAAVTGRGHLVQRDEDGFVNTPSTDLASDGHAVVSEKFEIIVGTADWFPWNDELDLRLRVTPEADDTAVLFGIAATDRAAVLAGAGRRSRGPDAHLVARVG